MKKSRIFLIVGMLIALMSVSLALIANDDKALASLGLKELLVNSSPAATDYQIVVDPNTKEPKLSLISNMPQMGGVTATATEINKYCDESAKAVVSLTANTSLTQAAHANRVCTLDKADGIAITLPEATGTGDVYTLILGTALSSNTVTITAADTTNTDYVGNVMAVDLDAATTAVMYQSVQATGNDIITMNATTQGGVNIGCDYYILTDIKTDVWQIEGKFLVPAGSNPATPFSSTP